MADKHQRHVTKRQDGLWQDKAAGAQRAASLHTKQKDAEAASKQVARNTPGGAEVITHRGDNNRIRSSDTINRPDPNPPKDKEH
jgi:hypothetical protein